MDFFLTIIKISTYPGIISSSSNMLV